MTLDPRPGLIPSGLDGTLVLLRHGESEFVAQGLFQGQGDSPLSETGRRQATLAAARLANPAHPPALPLPSGPPLEIVHSPLSRTAETARLVGGAMAAPDSFGGVVPARAEPGLLEIGQGEWEGVAGAVVSERWGDTLAGWRMDPLRAWAPGGESLPEVEVRVRGALTEILANLAAAAPERPTERAHVLGYGDLPSNEPWAVLVGHDGVFKVTLLALLDLPLSRFWTFPFALCGITVVELRDGRPRLRLHNQTEHLAPLESAVARAAEARRGRSGAL